MSTATITHGQAGREAAWALNRSRTRARLEDLEFLLAIGEDPARAVERCGWTAGAAARAAYRYGQPDLARALGRITSAHRTTGKAGTR